MSNKLLKSIYKSTHIVLILCIFLYFFHCINSSGNLNYLIYKASNFPFGNNDSVSVNINLSDDDPYNILISDFVNKTFTTRNESFLNGEVKDLYKYYNIDSNNSRYSLDYEFKRISYLRDWSLERGIIFTSIDSLIVINSILKKDNSLIVKLDEQCTFSYIHNNGKAKNTFSMSIPHILTLYDNYGEFTIDKDYFVDFLNDDLQNYNFTLSEESLPYTKRLNINFKINDKLKVDNVLRYEKFPFTDHKAIISNFDSNGYPLITTSIHSIENMPYDLGWSSKNIKLSSY